MSWTLTICALIGLTSICFAAPTSSHIGPDTWSRPTSLETPSSSSLTSARKLPTQDVGLPSELAWQAWLVVASKPDAQTSFESATVPRRISPKSVFVAPKLESCAEGYQADTMGRCIKDTIKIEPRVHLQFIFERLNAMYPSGEIFEDSAVKNPELKKSAVSGPLQVNISLGIDENWSQSRSPSSSEKPEREKDSEHTVEISVVEVPPSKESLAVDGKPDTKSEPVLISYEIGKDPGVDREEEETFFRGNLSQSSESSSVREVLVPVAEFVDAGNQTFAEVVDYEIPLTSGQLFNVSPTEATTMKNITDSKPTIDDVQPPTVVLLLSPTKLTSAASTPYAKESDSHRGTTEPHISVRTGIEAVNLRENHTSPFVTEGLNFSSHDIAEELEKEGVTLAEGLRVDDDATTSEIPETVPTTNYTDEDADDTTELNDEILTHGEAGMLVVAGNFGTTNRPEEFKEATSTPENSPVVTNAEEDDSNISSEVTIRGDVILETTLLDLNTVTVTDATPAPTKPHHFTEVFEAEKNFKSKSSEPGVVLSPQDSHRTSGANSRDNKRSGDHATVSVSEERPETSSLPIPKESPVDPISTAASNAQLVHHVSRPAIHESVEDTSSPPQPRRRTSSSQEYVRFPDDTKQLSSSYVLFPSDHSNSINGNQNYKERAAYAQQNLHPQLTPKSSVPLHQKKTYWRLPPGWRIDDLQPPPQPIGAQSVNHLRQNPMLLRFWTRMPLFRDPSLTMNHQQQQQQHHHQHLSRVSPIVTQRGILYRETGPQAVNRILAQTVRGADPGLG